MPPVCFEVIRAIAADGYQANWSTVSGDPSILTTQPGFLGVWQGFEVEDPKYMWVLVGWETYEHHRAVVDNKELYAKMMDEFRKTTKEILSMWHFNVTGEMDKALDAPISEIVTWTANKSADIAEFKKGLGKLVEERDKGFPPGLRLGGGYGYLIEDERTVVGVNGWKDLASVIAAVASAPGFVAAAMALRPLGDSELKFVKLYKLQK
ncbi:hypothetical protein PsYK624_043780 [Phanerochaete sordida]|uniref:ABM domain-containing protein n=1 Tax=Phanerochaete sordida TaxID=48140 RepID=A0A9P3G5N9_9APHY|nr:hypothetical protein PsYK624_043780 [Phanerochaete sordida]